MKLRRGKDPNPKRVAPEPRTGAALGGFWLSAYVGVAVVLLVAAVVGGYAWIAREESLARAALLATAEAVARDAVHRAEAVRKRVEAWATDPTLQRALRSMDESAMRAKEEELRRQIPEALGIRLVVPNQAGIMEGGGPFASNAAIDLTDRAYREARVAGLEVHRVGQPEMHLAIAGPVLGGQGSKPLGVVHLALPMTVLPALTDLGGEAGRILYQQSAGKEVATLAPASGGDLPGTDAAGSVSIAGTTLRIGVWPRPVDPFSGGLLAWLIIGDLVGLALAGLALWVPYRTLKQALAADRTGLIALVEEGVMGRHLPNPGWRLAETGLLQDALVPLLEKVGSARARPAAGREPTAASPAEGIAEHWGAEGGPLSGPDSGPASQQVSRTADLPPAGVRPMAGALHLASDVFHGDDIRGVVGKGIDAALMRAIGQAVGTEVARLGGKAVMLARDTRPSSAGLAQAVSEGLRASGRDVIDLGVAPTPLLYFATRFQGDSSGVMVTASHNPLEYNGCKVVLQGKDADGDQLRAIERRVREGDLLDDAPGGYEVADLAALYVAHVDRDVTVARGLKVVVDGGNGPAALLAPALYRALGCEVVELNCDLDGGFPGGEVADPCRPEKVRDLAAAVCAQGADLGLAFDGDGDRLGVVDSKGVFIAMDRVLMLYAADVLSRCPGTDVVYDVKCSHLLAGEILRNGGRPVMWQSGHARLKAKLRETGGQLAGELSGHVIFQERWFGFDDAVYAGARLLELLSLDPRPSAEVFASLPDALGTPELLLPVAPGEGQRIMDQVLALADRLDGVTVKTVDGLRAEFDGGWGLVRASNTLPALSFRFQGDDQESLEMIQGLFRRVMERAAPGLTLPF